MSSAASKSVDQSVPRCPGLSVPPWGTDPSLSGDPALSVPGVQPCQSPAAQPCQCPGCTDPAVPRSQLRRPLRAQVPAPVSRRASGSHAGRLRQLSGPGTE